jgi:uncharacterized membrane protein
MKKNTPQFEDVSQSEYEKILMAKFRARDKEMETYGPLYHLLFLISIGAIAAIAIVILAIMNWKHIQKLLKSIDNPGTNSIIVLVVIAAIICGYYVVRSAKRSGND